MPEFCRSALQKCHADTKLANVDRSDLVVCCIEHYSGGAYQTVEYARRQGKEIVNLEVRLDTP